MSRARSEPGAGYGEATSPGPALAQGPFVQLRHLRGSVRTPVSSRTAAFAGLALYAPCRPGAIALHRALWRAVSAVGPAALPGGRHSWWPPTGLDAWSELCRSWVEHFGPVDAAAVYEPPQLSRGGFAVLLVRDEQPVAFVKLRRDGRLDQEERALRVVSGASERFQAPRPCGHGEVEGWAWLALTSLPLRPHRPADGPPLAALTREIQDLLGDTLPRPGGIPAHWRPMHGDLTPWNLRRVRGAGLWLFDWEDVGWAPPGADLAYFAATQALVFGREPGWCSEETMRFWTDRIGARSVDDFDRPSNDALHDVLRQMAGVPSTA